MTEHIMFDTYELSIDLVCVKYHCDPEIFFYFILFRILPYFNLPQYR